MKKLVSHTAHKWVRITLRALLGQAQCKRAGASVEKLSWQQLFDTVAWHDECLSELTMDHA